MKRVTTCSWASLQLQTTSLSAKLTMKKVWLRMLMLEVLMLVLMVGVKNP
jgi:hypothetical protein